MKAIDTAVRFEGEMAYIQEDGVNLTTDLVNHRKEIHVQEGVRKLGALRFADIACDVYLPATLESIRSFEVDSSAKVRVHFLKGNKRFLDDDPSILFAKKEGRLFYSAKGAIPRGTDVIEEGALDGYNGDELHLPSSVEWAHLDFQKMKARSLYFDSLIKFSVRPVKGLKVFLGRHAGFVGYPIRLGFDDPESGFFVDPDNEYYYPLEGALVEKESDDLLYLPATQEIPPFVKSIETMAIGGKSRIELIVPDSVVEFDCAAIAESPNLKRLHLGKGVEEFGRWAMEEASNLAYFSASEDNPYFYVEGNCLIRKEDHTLVLGGPESVIPPSAKAIAAGAFVNPPVDFLIPSSVLSLAPGMDCDLPAVKGKRFHTLYLDSPCFDGLSIGDVDKLILGPHFPRLKRYGLRGQIHGKVKEVALEGDNSGLTITKGYGLIDKAGTLLLALDGFYFTPDIKRIGYQAFAYSDIEELIVPDSVASLDRGAFDYMMNLTRLVIPGSIPAIPEHFLWACPKLEEIVLGEGVKKLERCAFSELHCLKLVFLPASLDNIVPWQFVNCPNIERIEIPEEGNYRFEDGYDCLIDKRKEEVVFAFGRLRLPEGVKSIGEGAMRGYQQGYPLMIPASVEWLGPTVGHEASFRTIGFKGNKIKVIPEAAFASVDLSQPALLIPEGVEEIGDNAFAHTPIESLSLPSTLKKIGAKAFGGAGIYELTGLPTDCLVGDRAFKDNPIENLVQNNGQKR